MHVIAAPGLLVPRESDPLTRIEPAPADAVEVPDTSYYRRRVAEGELLLVKKTRSGAKSPAKGADE
ncbi:Protein of unknown function [Pseudomonas sp. NFPP10]|uniref:DUF2635 domain-containing protein n=1 Tax=Pseudomonas saponiphila TaxID=556534 RepID=UPI00089155E1|nr:DUF2635 domain-containing protein [Pseudomonas saponiphila]SDA18135.1 Protein of unknown function [Pseudomonas sp. NFPP12]SEK98820.1 Protein of unknown function [Pseudomonas sp. NFPP10]SFI57514.1 Protein of unknown function [Pseudomonas sp. NFPP08]SFM42780.1 Protein of unknown function [Pseudomonas sp. NFPP05]SFX31233.1 Protein of unknown function [Pseudomonas sp. NFPP09]